MNTPAFQQLTGLLEHVKAGLRVHSYLTGTIGWTPAQACALAVPYKVFERQRDGIGLYLDIKRANLPVLAIYPEEVTDADDQIGDEGLEMVFGVQYLFSYRAAATDMAAEAKAVHAAHATLWAVRALLDNPEAVCTASHIRGVTFTSASFIPPTGAPVRGWEGKGRMIYTMPPWQLTPNVVDLDAIYGDLNETGDVGASPLETMDYDYPVT